MKTMDNEMIIRTNILHQVQVWHEVKKYNGNPILQFNWEVKIQR